MNSYSPRLRTEILELIPSLRAFARSLTKNHTEADDLLQDTLVKALANIHQFTPGSNLRAWLFTIQRNTFYTNHKKNRRRHASALDDTEGIFLEPSQDWSTMMMAVHSALNQLSEDQREAVMLVGGSGLSYEEAAGVCGCALGTIKSRVSRARARMLELLHVHQDEEFLGVNRRL